MAFLKKVKWNVIISSVLYVLTGVLMILWPDIMADNICKLTGIVAIVIGLMQILSYVRNNPVKSETYSYSLVIGLAAVLIGIFLYARVDAIKEFIPFILGLFVTISGFMKLQNAIDLIRSKYAGWELVFIIALVNVAFGIVLMANPFKSGLVLVRCLGVGLIYSGVSDLIATIMLSKCIKRAAQANGSTELVEK